MGYRRLRSGQPGDGSANWSALPPPRLIEGARAQVAAAAGPDRRLLVVDDDATGSQAVHDVSILLSFDVDQLAEAFHDPGACAFVLTNSRSLDAGRAARLNRDIGTAALEYCNSAGLHLSVISRERFHAEGAFVRRGPSARRRS